MPGEITTNEATVSQRKEEIIKEAKRVAESAMHSSKGHFSSSAIWRGLHLCLGLPTTILASIAAATAFSQLDGNHTVGGWVSIIVAALSALTTFLNPNARSAAHFAAGNSYGALQDKARIFWTLDCWGSDSDQVLTKRLKDLSEEKHELNRKSPQIPWYGRAIAKRGIAAGEAEYAVDKPKT